VKTYNFAQGTEEWLRIRRGKITASRFGDMMTQGKKKEDEFGKTAISYAYEIMTGWLTDYDGEEGYTNKNMEWGTEYEAEARQAYQLETFNYVKQIGFVELNEFVGGSPDGLIGEDGGLEIKCPKKTTHLATILGKKMPDIHIPQVQGSMYITDRAWWDFVSYHPLFKTNKLFIVRVKRDDEYISQLKDRIEKFKKLIDRLTEQI